MAELSPVYDGKVVHSGIFNFKELYRFMYEWFRDWQYDVFEKKYSEKVKADGKDLEIEWLCLRKISDYFRFRVKIVTRIIRMVSVEIQEDGIKVSKDKGEIEIKFWGYLEKDYENKWEQNPISKFLRGLYDRYMVKSRAEFYEEKLISEVDEGLGQIKAFLTLSGKH